MDSEKTVKLSIVIVNYKTPQMLIDCLESLLPELHTMNAACGEARVVIVDNKSNDDSVAQIAGWLSAQNPFTQTRITLVESPRNGGFSAGNNLGIAEVAACYYLLLNSDTIVRPGAITTLVKRMEGDCRLGALGPRLEYLDGRPQVSRFRRRGVTSELIRGAQLDLITRIFRAKNTAIELDEPEQEIDWISFACVLLRADVIAQVGDMDEGFFMYFEDIEYCLRIKSAGYAIKQELDARVVHLRGGTSSVKRNDSNQQRIPAYFYQSRSRYFTLLGGRRKLFWANIAWYTGRLLRLCKRVARSTVGPSIPCEWADLWRGFFTSQRQHPLPVFKNNRQVT
ncbi:glycosyltransferase [Microbulbifer sp. SH-1]|uniref:glycosyltransferase family 2 protein n=1 Tax=Microbulbifer sp. SH-1 TaxID=2681547 RepID=UPI00140C42E1|nr:glycosyltransferase family 2 protein [Microbulbifer sp. SH-1]QIL90632.1 glycosyltransferase [Microbulbifer sp. SH-1]